MDFEFLQKIFDPFVWPIGMNTIIKANRPPLLDGVPLLKV
jgi:hypothetical protein